MKSHQTRIPSLMRPWGGSDSGRKYVPAGHSSGGEVCCHSGCRRLSLCREWSLHTEVYESCSLLYAQPLIGFPHSEFPAARPRPRGAVREPERRNRRDVLVVVRHSESRPPLWKRGTVPRPRLGDVFNRPACDCCIRYEPLIHRLLENGVF